ncbi:hypothetical protein [Halopiger goleimassiliensis]|uniref:hypothetical protein n=1 Tax=Halopiger goleimassiliensis TaxID=1293048 RepID=UPI000677EB01|nr:hypothetical protein [Halopiger goleimassiliensis]
MTLNPELLVESITLLLYTAVAAALTGGGLIAEYSGIQQLGGGEMTVGLWLAGIGCVMLYAGVYGIGYQKLLTRVLTQ